VLTKYSAFLAFLKKGLDKADPALCVSDESPPASISLCR